MLVAWMGGTAAADAAGAAVIVVAVEPAIRCARACCVRVCAEEEG